MQSVAYQKLNYQIKQNFLAHRLNSCEMMSMAGELQNCQQGVGDSRASFERLQEYSEITTDWHGPTRLSYPQALQALGLDQEYASLHQSRVWSPYERALYRRLSAPQNDPAAPSPGLAKSGNVEFVAAAKSLFVELDQDHNGHLTAIELDRALSLEHWNDSQAACLVMLRRFGPQLSGCVPSDGEGPSIPDLQAFEKQGIPNDAATTIKLNQLMGYLKEQFHKLPERVPLMQENMLPKDVNQHRAGSCVMISALRSCEEQTVREMFQDHGDGTITVHFKDGLSERVADLTSAERLYHAAAAQEGRWPGVLEKAMGQRISRNRPPADGSSRSAINGQSPSDCIAAFSGREAVVYDLDKLSPEQTRQALLQLEHESGPIIFGSRNISRGADNKVSVEALHTGIANNHAYAPGELKYDPVSDEVSLANPWHQGEWIVRPDARNDGNFHMPLLDFYCNYSKIFAPAPQVPAHPNTST